MGKCSNCSGYIKKNDYRAKCSNCNAEICEDCENDEVNMIHGNLYCNHCYNEMGDELESPDLGDDGAYNNGY